MLGAIGVVVPEILDRFYGIKFTEPVWWRVGYAKLQARYYFVFYCWICFFYISIFIGNYQRYHLVLVFAHSYLTFFLCTLKVSLLSYMKLPFLFVFFAGRYIGLSWYTGFTFSRKSRHPCNRCVPIPSHGNFLLLWYCFTGLDSHIIFSHSLLYLCEWLQISS